MTDERSDKTQLTRRDLFRSAAATGAGLILSRMGWAQGAPGKAGDLNVAFIGTGLQGMVLLRDTLKIPGIRVRAACDIWNYSRRYASGTVRKAKQPKPKVYVDYREMLAAEKDLDAVIIATPDWMHAEHAVAAMKAGLHVYCEKEMSNTLEKAAAIVGAARETKKLCQIGHQRRSNPVYLLALDMLGKDKALGRITNCYGQWNRAAQDKLTWPKRYEIPADVLKKYGYDTMDRLRNWRWYKKFSAGPIADLGSHQIDVFSWFLGAEPASVMAAGGGDYYKDRDWYEDVMAIYEYKTKAGSVRAFYQVQNTNGFGHYFERFMGDRGTLTISEDPRKCSFVPERGIEPPKWMGTKRVNSDGHDAEPHVAVPLVKAFAKMSAAAEKAMVRWEKKNIHQLHLENFFAAVRAGDAGKLTCPPEVAYPTAVAVLNVSPAIEAGKKVQLTAEAYKV